MENNSLHHGTSKDTSSKNIPMKCKCIHVKDAIKLTIVQIILLHIKCQGKTRCRSRKELKVLDFTGISDEFEVNEDNFESFVDELV